MESILAVSMPIAENFDPISDLHSQNAINRRDRVQKLSSGRRPP
jgi:hypothetical protein